jgi:DNA-binding beta-propeller fold protein YncE
MSSAPAASPVTWDPLAISMESGSSTRVPSPATGLLPDGRQLHPQGKQVTLGNLPMGAALTADGRYLWTVSAGLGNDDVRIVDTASDRVCQILPLPGASGGIALDSRHRLAYVSGLRYSLWIPTMSKVPGADGNDVLVFSWTSTCGQARLVRVIPVPPPPGAPTLQAFPVDPSGTTSSWPQQLAVSPDGSKLLVALNLADSAAVIDLNDADQVRYVPMGSGAYPFGAAILPGGRTGLISNEATGTLAFIDMQSATRLASISVGPMLSHPQGIAVDSAGARAYVALSNRDEVAVVNLRTRRLERTLSVKRSAGRGTMPTAVALAPSGNRLFVAESGADELSVIRVPSKGTPSAQDWTIVGRIATADEPEAVLTSAAQGGRPARLIWVAARGMDVGPNTTGPNPTLADDPIFWAFHPIPPPTYDIFDTGITYTAAILRGSAGLMALPSDAQVSRLTPAALAQLQPVGAEQAPAGTPIRAHGPIKHVFFIVRENRSYDQMLGGLGRGNGDPQLQVFGPNVTPNMHALLKRFPLLDNVMANSDASIQGHFWTASAGVPDYVSRNWVHYYDARLRPSDFGMYAVSWPGNGFLFDQAEREHISYFNYGEGLSDSMAQIPDRDRTPAMLQEVKRVAANSDNGPGITPGGCYPPDLFIGTVGNGPPTTGDIFDSTLPASAPAGSYSHAACFEARFVQQLAHNDVPALNYLSLTDDHTRGTQVGYLTPTAMVADNDLALGQIVDTISHSQIWSSSAIFVVEDDSQDGADHVDAHRIPALVISPYARRDVMIHTRYDLMSIVRTIELIIGMKPLTLNDATAIPMYDVFSPKPVNSAPINAAPAHVNLLARNKPSSPDAKLSDSLPLHQTDMVPQQTLDGILWQSVYGANSTPPPPGPNAAAGDQ